MNGPASASARESSLDRGRIEPSEQEGRRREERRAGEASRAKWPRSRVPRYSGKRSRYLPGPKTSMGSVRMAVWKTPSSRKIE